MLTVLFWCMICGLLLSAIASTASMAFQEAQWHELEEYCKRRRNQELFSRVFDLRDQMWLGAVTLQMVAMSFFICSLFGWFIGDQLVSKTEPMQLVSIFVLAGFALLLVGSWIPWGITRIAASVFIYHTWRWWWLVSLVSWPLLIGGRFVSAMFERASGIEPELDDEEEAFEDEILSMVSEAEHDGFLEAPTRDMIEGVMELDDNDVAGVMTPRSKVDSLEINTSWDEMVKFVVESGRTRIPVYDGKIDNIVGILYAKDLLRESMRSESKRRPMIKLLREPLVVPESKILDEMLSQFLGRHVHMAIVQDEYGGFAGVVTIEDVLEEIVGEIVDETDEDRSKDIEKLNPLQADVEGTVPICRLNEELGLDLPEEEEFDTVSGLLMGTVKEIPREGHEITIGNVMFKIQKATRHSIISVRITIAEDDDAQGSGASNLQSQN